jgi:EAL domain-containing protein (putative c-di-GMP-specific phosphodiesterase class I)
MPAAMPLTDLLRHPAPPRPGTGAVDRLLQALRQHLDMDIAFVSEFRTTDRVFRHVDARGRSPIQPGDALPLDRGYCQRVVDGRLPQLIPDTRRVAEAMALPETGLVPIGAHLSVPIHLADGHVYGTLCCFSFAADPTLGERDLRMMQVFALLLAEQVDADLARQRAHAEKSDRISAALAARQPTLLYQPVYDLATGQLAGVEALSRFRMEPARPPDQWFAEAAEVGLGPTLELAAISAALDEALPRLPEPAHLAVNCSPLTALDADLPRVLGEVDLRRVVLEITEHDHIDDYPALVGAMEPLRAAGLRIAIDDAGAGYASLRHVLNLHPEFIKLDLSLTRDIDSDPTRRALATALIAFARETSACIVAEGVETPAELATLHRLGAGSAQGFHLARPLPLEQALRHPFPAGVVQ